MKGGEWKKAIGEALSGAMTSDPGLILLGNRVGESGGLNGSVAGLLERFGPVQVVQTEARPAGLGAFAAGLSLCGGRAVVELRPAELSGALSVWKRLYVKGRGPVFLAVPEGRDDSLCLVPDVATVVPSDVADGFAQLKSVLSDGGPSVFWEGWNVPPGDQGNAGEGFAARTLRDGTDLTVVSFGEGIGRILQAVDRLSEEGIRPEVIDLRSLNPLDGGRIVAGVAKTNKLMMVPGSPGVKGLSDEVAALAMTSFFDSLEAPLKICGPGDSVGEIVSAIRDLATC